MSTRHDSCVSFSGCSSSNRHCFERLCEKLVRDLKAQDIRGGLRVKPVSRNAGVIEMTWAADGRATFEYGDPVRPGEGHTKWRRIGTHDILDEL